MSILKSFNRARWAEARSDFQKFASGGDWSIEHPAATRRSLTWFWFDGFFASASDNIALTYLTVYILALGATQAQIGVMSSISSLFAALLLMPGAMMVERSGHRRKIVLLASTWGRTALLMLALVPFFGNAPGLVILAMALSISRDSMTYLSYPAWMSLTGDIVPIEGRGRYFASRNFIMSLSGMAITLLAGLLITHVHQQGGYQIAFALAFALGCMSIFSFGHLPDKPASAARAPSNEGISLRGLLRTLVAEREFRIFVAITALWNFSLNVAGPFFNVYLVKNLHATGTMIALTAIATSLTTMLSQRKLGELNDRWGSRRLTIIAGLLIPIVPVFWVFTNAAWNVILINLVSGLFWGAYNLGSFNYLLGITPDNLRARYSAIFQIVVTLSLASGAALGSLIITKWGYNAVFLGSAGGRMVAAILFAVLTVRQVRIARKSAES